jgi:hypothetical protein
MLQVVRGEIAWKKDAGVIIPAQLAVQQKIGMAKIAHGKIVIAIKMDAGNTAIKQALSGEVTTKKEEKMRGYGLKSCKDISLKEIKGELHVVSRKGLVVLKDDGEPKLYDFTDVSLNGTSLYFRLPTPKKQVNIYPYLEG